MCHPSLVELSALPYITKVFESYLKLDIATGPLSNIIKARKEAVKKKDPPGKDETLYITSQFHISDLKEGEVVFRGKLNYYVDNSEAYYQNIDNCEAYYQNLDNSEAYYQNIDNSEAYYQNIDNSLGL